MCLGAVQAINGGESYIQCEARCAGAIEAMSLIKETLSYYQIPLFSREALILQPISCETL